MGKRNSFNTSFETYVNGNESAECPLENGSVIVIDKLGNIERRDTIAAVNGVAKDTIKGVCSEFTWWW